jgi:predicted N-acetyltransferase YhbS
MAQSSDGRDVVQGLDEPRLVAAMEENAALALCEFALGAGGESYQGPEMTRYISGLQIAFFNGVIAARLDPSQIDASITAALAPFQARNLPLTWMVGPGTQPQDLGQRLVAHGLELAGESPWMAIDISAVAPRQLIPDVTFIPVTTIEQVAWFAHVSAVSFGVPPEVEPSFQRIAAHVCLTSDQHWLLHLALLDGAPVATCMTYLQSGVAGLYTIATLPEARNRGIAGELTRDALLNAQERGYHVAALQASRMGYPVYQRLGFQTCATFHEYEWTPRAS